MFQCPHALFFVVAALIMGPAAEHAVSAEFRGGELPAAWSVLDGEWTSSASGLVASAERGPARLRLASHDSLGARVEIDLAEMSSGAVVEIVFGASSDGTRGHALGARAIGSEKDGRFDYELVRAGGRDLRARGRGASREEGAAASLVAVATRGRVRLELGARRVLDSAIADDLTAGDVELRVVTGRAVMSRVGVERLDEQAAAELRPRYGVSREVPLIAHRGSSSTAPENTIAAFRRGLEEEADGVEFDVYRSRDRRLVVVHDKDVERTSDAKSVLAERPSLRVDQLDFADLRRLDVGAWKSPEFAGERMPTLRETLDAIAPGAVPVVEIKPEDIGPDVAREIREAGLAPVVFVQSFSARAVRECRELLPEATMGYLTGDRVSEDEIERARSHLAIARQCGANAVVCDWRVVGPDYARELDRQAMTLWVYTVDDPFVAETLVRLGVDGVITNRPGALRAELAARRSGARGEPRERE